MYLNVNLTPPPAAGEGHTPKTPEILNTIINMTPPDFPESYSYYSTQASTTELLSPASSITSPCEEAKPLCSAGGGAVGGEVLPSGGRRSLQQSPTGNASFSSTATTPTNSVEAAKSALIKEGLKYQIRSKLMASGSSSRLLLETAVKEEKSEDTDELTSEDEERRKRRRERNKVAATKCRNKKKERTVTLIHESESVETQNVKLKSEIQRLQSEKLQLEKLLKDPSHTSCCKHKRESANIDEISPSIYHSSSSNRPPCTTTTYNSSSVCSSELKTLNSNQRMTSSNASSKFQNVSEFSGQNIEPIYSTLSGKSFTSTEAAIKGSSNLSLPNVVSASSSSIPTIEIQSPSTVKNSLNISATNMPTPFQSLKIPGTSHNFPNEPSFSMSSPLQSTPPQPYSQPYTSNISSQPTVYSTTAGSTTPGQPYQSPPMQSVSGVTPRKGLRLLDRRLCKMQNAAASHDNISPSYKMPEYKLNKTSDIKDLNTPEVPQDLVGKGFEPTYTSVQQEHMDNTNFGNSFPCTKSYSGLPRYSHYTYQERPPLPVDNSQQPVSLQLPVSTGICDYKTGEPEQHVKLNHLLHKRQSDYMPPSTSSSYNEL